MAVVEPLELVRVRRVGRRLVLGVRGEHGRRDVITFRLAQVTDAINAYMQACDWLHARTRLAYVRGGRESALFNVDALFARALV